MSDERFAFFTSSDDALMDEQYAGFDEVLAEARRARAAEAHVHSICFRSVEKLKADAESAKRPLEERLRVAEALIRRMGIELCYANSGGEIPTVSAEGEGLIHDAEEFIGRPVKHWAEASDLPPWEKRFVCGHETQRAALSERLRVARGALEKYGQHTPLCRGQKVNVCDCGLTQALGG
jgi:hypothetical protein